MKNQQTTPKTAVVTLRAGGSTLTLLATAKPDGTAVTSVTTRDADRKSSRGMTEAHKDMNAAKAHLVVLAKQAEGLGWQRRRVSATRPDAFSTLPAPKPSTEPEGISEGSAIGENDPRNLAEDYPGQSITGQETKRRAGRRGRK